MVCVSIVNSKLAEAYRLNLKALYLKYRLLKPCKFNECLACTLQKEDDVSIFSILHNNMLDVPIKCFTLDKPSSDNSWAFIKLAKKDFGRDVAI